MEHVYNTEPEINIHGIYYLFGTLFAIFASIFLSIKLYYLYQIIVQMYPILKNIITFGSILNTTQNNTDTITVRSTSGIDETGKTFNELRFTGDKDLMEFFKKNFDIVSKTKNIGRIPVNHDDKIVDSDCTEHDVDTYHHWKGTNHSYLGVAGFVPPIDMDALLDIVIEEISKEVKSWQSGHYTLPPSRWFELLVRWTLAVHSGEEPGLALFRVLQKEVSGWYTGRQPWMKYWGKEGL